ncbi:TPA: hypothetical protein ACGFAK_004981 [Serratia marcescens]|uniref:hypothetical protein n=1 Tax=Serratia marcescens TaxID=615 RepID=UPI0036FD1723
MINNSMCSALSALYHELDGSDEPLKHANEMKKRFKCILDVLIESIAKEFLNDRFNSFDELRNRMSEVKTFDGNHDVIKKLKKVLRGYYIISRLGYTVDDDELLNFYNKEVSSLVISILSLQCNEEKHKVLKNYLLSRSDHDK